MLMGLDPVRLQVRLAGESEAALLARISNAIGGHDLDLSGLRLAALPLHLSITVTFFHLYFRLDRHYLHSDLLLLSGLLRIALPLMDPLVVVEQAEVRKDQPAHLALEADGVLRERHLVDQRVVVGERLSDVALVVGQLRHVDGRVLGLGHGAGVGGGDFVDHVDVGVAE